MKRVIPTLFDTLHLLALAVWLGGLAMLWIAVLPASRVASDPAAVQVAAMKHFGAVVELCGVAMVAIQWRLGRRYKNDRSRYFADGVRTLLTFTAFFISEYARYTTGATAEHMASAGMIAALAQVALLIAVAGITCWLPSIVAVKAVPATPAPAPQPATPIVPPANRARRKAAVRK